MSLPAGYMAWCRERGITPYHPAEWHPADLAAFRAWKRAWYIAKWRMYRDRGLLSAMPRDLLRSRVREDLDRLQAPPPSRPYGICPCHARGGQHVMPEAMAHGLAYIHTFRRSA